MDILYKDNSIIVCIKPAGVRSTDEPGGVPELIRQQLGDSACDIRTVHRLDQVVSGLMLLAASSASASELSRQIREGEFDKSYLAVVRGRPEKDGGRFTDLLLRNKYECKTYVVSEPGKGVQEAILDYELIANTDELSKVRIHLITGRTHQIRCQFASRGHTIIGDRKYGDTESDCNIALWSHEISFTHPESGERLHFTAQPPDIYPWNKFDI